MKGLGFVHRFVPASSIGERATLLLLHGTGGNEDDLLDIGRYILPGAALLSPRGRVLENGMPRFFRRISEGVFDLDDLKLQTELLSNFVREASRKYEFAAGHIIAVGYSNGANIASSLLLTHPASLAGAILFRPMVPFVPDPPAILNGKPVLLSAGRWDPMADARHITRLSGIFKDAEARVSIHWHEGGHELGNDDFEAARDWAAARPFDDPTFNESIRKAGQ